jgi:hypothetical protein
MPERRIGERRQEERRKGDRRVVELRQQERRWRNARFYFIERRKGRAWTLGSIALALALWTYLLARDWP